MKQYAFILAVVITGAGLYGCSSRDTAPNELVAEEKNRSGLAASIRKGDYYAKAGEKEKVCSQWKRDCEQGRSCYEYVLSCLDDRSMDAGEFIDQDLLAKIVVKDVNPDVRAAAARSLADQTLLATIAVKDKDEYVRSIAVENLEDQTLIARIATEDRHELVRRAAVNTLTDEALLAKIALEDSDNIVRSIAASKVTDQTMLGRIAIESEDTGIRESAVKKLTSQSLLAKIAVEDEDIKIRSIATNKLADFARAKWANKSSEKYRLEDLLSTIEDSTEGRVPLLDGRETVAVKKERQIQTGQKSTEVNEKKATKTDVFSKNMGKTESDCGNDCFPNDIKPTGLSKGDRAVFLDFVYKGQKSGIYFIANKEVHEKLAALPRLLSYKKEKEEIKKDFILPRINNPLQRERLLPLVEKIKSLTPDVNKQARIAISLVQHIPYGFPTGNDSEINYEKKYPYSVIWEQTGICDEKSDLLLFLLRELGFGTATLIYKKEYHRAVGIKCPKAYDTGDSGYCYVEVTSPKIITDNSPDYLDVGSLTDFKVIHISEGRELEGVEEEFTDKILYYDLLLKAKAKNGTMDADEYARYSSILNKYGME